MCLAFLNSISEKNDWLRATRGCRVSFFLWILRDQGDRYSLKVIGGQNHSVDWSEKRHLETKRWWKHEAYASNQAHYTLHLCRIVFTLLLLTIDILRALCTQYSPLDKKTVQSDVPNVQSRLFQIIDTQHLQHIKAYKAGCHPLPKILK